MAIVAAGSTESVRKITEKSEKARREFFKKVEKIAKNHGGSAKLMQDIADQAANEYTKVFGRLGVHPLLHLKGGKKAVRYIVDRDEVWVLYKPALWQMGGSEFGWKKKVRELVNDHDSLEDAQKKLIESDKMEIVQEWHGLTHGMNWIDLDNPVMQWGFIQRLDVETDGPVVVAKTWRAQRFLQVQMREHVFSKAYMCLVHGRLENRIQHIKAKFSELGSDNANQVMLKYDQECDPFYNWSSSGRWKGRQVKTAETFFKPIAYYHRKEDNSEYTLVYVNILSGITHQVRITMQSVGHPLVSDDRYLPKDVAMADLKWCPRNFLSEVRSDWFDIGGPHREDMHKKFTRMSMENPLPKLFQNVLEAKLTLVEKIDPTADLFVGCQYWAIGDEQLMNAYPKDDEFRMKVMRWAMRRGIGLEAIDRLFMLPKAEIDEVLNAYRLPTDRDDDAWVCPVCQGFNHPTVKGSQAYGCAGFLGKDCEGKRVVEDEGAPLPHGWTHWISDPTLHMLMIINSRWLEARRKVLKFSRPSWERPPVEMEGSPADESVLVVLEAALVLNLKSGGFGIDERDLRKVPGLEEIKLPLQAPPEESNVQRVRLPGCGTFSQWRYTLKAKERVKYTDSYKVPQLKRHIAPVAVKTDALPERMKVDEAEKRKRKRDLEEQLEKAEEDEREKERAETQASLALSGMEDSVLDNGDGVGTSPTGKKAKTTARARAWKKLESASNPGHFYYFDADSGKSVAEKPADYEEEPPEWERIESKSVEGEYYYYNKETGESRADRPVGVEILGDPPPKKPVPVKEEGIAWKRMESNSKPGNYYYFNPKTGSNEMHPPMVDPPWVLRESKTKLGQYYYFHEETGETNVDPPTSARPATGPPPESSEGKKLAAKKAAQVRAATAVKAVNGGGGGAGQDGLPAGWIKKESDSHPGKFYYTNPKTGETSWQKPAKATSNWEKRESSSKPGQFYYLNRVTGETKWDTKDGNGPEE